MKNHIPLFEMRCAYKLAAGENARLIGKKGVCAHSTPRKPGLLVSLDGCLSQKYTKVPENIHTSSSICLEQVIFRNI